MKDNRNDRQYGQTSSGQQQNRGSQSNQGRMDEDRSSSGIMDDESYEQEDSDTFMGQQSRDSQFSQGTMGGSARPMGPGDQQRSGEYSSDDDIDDMDEMDDDEITSSLDEEEDMDILDDDESNQMDQRGRQNY